MNTTNRLLSDRALADAFAKACVRADTMRQEHIIQLAKALARRNSTSEEAEKKKLTQKAKQRKRAQRLRRARQKPSKGLATKLVEVVGGEERELIEQEDLVRACMEESCHRYSLSHACSLLHGQLLRDIGYLGVFAAWAR